MPKLRIFLKYWLPPVVWLLVIFCASADTKSAQHSSRFFEPLLRWLFPHMSAARIDSLHFLFRKCCHLAEYAVLGLLVWRALHQPQKNQPKPWRWTEAGLTLAVVLLYAASDELHQIFVPTRTAHVSDVFIDTAGAAFALLLLWLAGKSFKRW